ncbi:MAG: PaaI family thioesterase [Methanosarcinaceae archaeon]|nr:PaaI family thioesterase [Methanosarcinaceae archaeon]
MDRMQKYFQQANFADISGMWLTEVSNGYAKGEMKVEKRHLNVLGTVHGGALFTFADMVFAAASNSHGTVAVAIKCDISYVKAVSEGYLYAEAKETSINPRIGTYDVCIRDDKGDTIAIFNGMVYRKKDPLKLPG